MVVNKRPHNVVFSTYTAWYQRQCQTLIRSQSTSTNLRVLWLCFMNVCVCSKSQAEHFAKASTIGKEQQTYFLKTVCLLITCNFDFMGLSTSPLWDKLVPYFTNIDQNRLLLALILFLKFQWRNNECAYKHIFQLPTSFTGCDPISIYVLHQSLFSDLPRITCFKQR